MLPSKWIEDLSDEDAQALAERVFKARPLTVPDLPVASLQRKLEMTWQPDAGVLLEPGSLVKALALGNSLSPTLVSALPSSPIDGQEVYYLADATNGVVWHLRYRAASSSAYKWEVVGGLELSAVVDTSENRTGAGSDVYGNLTTAGPSVTVPLAGEYTLEYGCAVMIPTADFILASPKIGAAAAAAADEALTNGAANAWRTIGRRRPRKTVTAASTTVTLQYRIGNTAATGSFANRWLTAMPVRVG